MYIRRFLHPCMHPSIFASTNVPYRSIHSCIPAYVNPCIRGPGHTGTCIRTDMHTCIHASTHKCINASVHLFIPVYVSMHMCIFTCAYSHMHIHICIFTYAYSNMHIHICIFTYAYSLMHTVFTYASMLPCICESLLLPVCTICTRTSTHRSKNLNIQVPVFNDRYKPKYAISACIHTASFLSHEDKHILIYSMIHR